MDFSMNDGNCTEKELSLIDDRRLKNLFHCTRQERSVYHLTFRDGDPNLYFPRRSASIKPSKPVVNSFLKKRCSIQEDLVGVTPNKKSLKSSTMEKSRNSSMNSLKDSSDQCSQLSKLFHSGIDKDRQLFKKSEYKNTLNKTFRDNMKITFLEEGIHEQRIRFIVEIGKIDALKTKMTKLKEEFDKYVENEHGDTMEMMDSAEKMVKMNQNKMSSLQLTLSSLGTIKNGIDDLLEDYEKCRNCEKLLYNLSPDSWKKRDGCNLSASSLGPDDEEESELYFQNTDELLKFFSEYESTCYRLIVQLLDFELIIENTLEAISQTEYFYDRFLSDLEAMRVKLEDGIRLEENQCDDARNYALELIQGPFKDLTAGREYLLISSYLQDIYNICFVGSSYSVTPTQMFRALEEEYRFLQFEEDSFPTALYLEATMKYRAKNQKSLECAEKTRKQLIDLDNKTQRLMKLLEPPQKNLTRKLVYRSNLIEKHLRRRPTTPPISDEEKLYLYLFTDQCDADSITRHNLEIDQAAFEKYFVEL